MIRNGLWVIGLTLVHLTGCEAQNDEEERTCLLVFDYAYNDQGHIEELTLDQSGDGSVDARVEYLNTYNDDGLITEVVTRAVRTDDELKFETHHELNEFGRTVYSLYEGEEIKLWVHESGESKSVEQRTFSYTAEFDDARRLISETMDLDADGTPDERELNTYDENGRRSKYEIDEGADGTVEVTTNYTYTFTEQGSYESIIWEEIAPIVTTVTEFTYEYDEENRVIGRTIDVRQDGIPEEECTISYSDEGEEEFCETLVNGTVTRERTQVKDAEGNLVMSLTVKVDDGAASRGTYTYDDSRNRLTALSEVRDNEDAEWETTLYSTYTYDEEGTKLSENREIMNWGPSTETCADSYLPGYQLTLSR